MDPPLYMFVSFQTSQFIADIGGAIGLWVGRVYPHHI